MRIDIEKIDGTRETYRIAVAAVEERAPDGRPLRIRLLGMDEPIDVAVVNDFMTIFVSERAMRKQN